MEALVFGLMNSLDLRFTAAHVHTKATNVIEARMTFDCEQPVFSRWQVRCKKTDLLTVDDVAIHIKQIFRRETQRANQLRQLDI